MTPSSSDGNPIPRGIEVLVKKASVDADFKRLLLDRRARAAEEIGLELSPSEAAMLNAVPVAQLEAIIAQTVVSPMTRAAFLGRAAAAMLAALAGSSGLAGAAGVSRGVSPVRPPVPADGFVLCEETNYRGIVSHDLLDAAAFRDRVALADRTNRLLAHAHALAAKAWGEDPAHKDVAFPLPLPGPLRCVRLEVFADRDAGVAARNRRQDEDAKRADAAAQVEGARLAALSKAAREAEMKRLELLRAAQQLFEDQLKKLLAAGVVPPSPMPPGGVRPDVPLGPSPVGPPAAGGVRPDRP